jgi:histidyl-tRNA synthetase
MASTTAEELNQQIVQQSALLNDLRKQQAEPSVVDEVKKKLGDLKRALGQLTGGAKDSSKKKERMLLKTAKVCFLARI